MSTLLEFDKYTVLEVHKGEFYKGHIDAKKSKGHNQLDVENVVDCPFIATFKCNVL